MRLVDEIEKLILEIETDYPELYAHLDEDPATLNYFTPDGKVSDADLRNYMESLKEKLNHYKKDHKPGGH